MKTIEIVTTHIHDDPLPDRWLPAHAELRLIASSRAELEALVRVLSVALGDAVSFDHPRPARRGWRVYAAVSVKVEVADGDE